MLESDGLSMKREENDDQEEKLKGRGVR